MTSLTTSLQLNIQININTSWVFVSVFFCLKDITAVYKTTINVIFHKFREDTH